TQEVKKNTKQKAKNQTSRKPQKTRTPSEKKTKKQTNHKQTDKPENQPARKRKHRFSTPASPSRPKDEAKAEKPVFLELDNFKQHWTSTGKTRSHSASS